MLPDPITPQEPAPPQAPNNEQTQAQTPPAVPQSWEEIFKHPRFAELTTRASRAEKALQDAQKKTLEEQNNYKALYETQQKELEIERKEKIKLLVAGEKGLTPKQASRLIGETKEDLERDADEMLEDFADKIKSQSTTSTTTQGVPPHAQNGQGNKFDFTAETDPAKIREQARKK